MSARISSSAVFCEPGEIEGQRGERFFTQPPVARDRQPALPFLAGAHQRERKLVREQLVEGQARDAPARSAPGPRPISAHAPRGAQRARQPTFRARGTPCRPIRAVPARARSLRAPRGARGRGGQPRGQRVDRLDGLELRQLVLAADVIGMRHLEDAVVALDLAADDALCTDRQRFFQVILLCAEKDQLHESRSSSEQMTLYGRRGVRGALCTSTLTVMVAMTPSGAAAIVGAKDRSISPAGKCHRRSTIMRARDALDQLADAWADARQRGQGREQGEQDFRAHPRYPMPNPSGRRRAEEGCLRLRGP